MRPALAGIVMLAFATYAHAQQVVPEPDGYRSDNYRAPVPATLRGARVVATPEAEAIWRAGAAVFIDVMPRAPKPVSTSQMLPGMSDLGMSLQIVPAGRFRGFGALAAPMEAYFRRGLAQASGGDTAKPLLFYCQAQCWMSWNAAKRALSYGYSNVAWYPDGTDGWDGALLPLVDAQPEPRPEDAAPAR
jgi:PQQ-dependent catabolism-associated CXXCW motif protein